MRLLLTTLLTTCALLAQGAGMPPTSSLVMRDPAAAQDDKVGNVLDTGLTFTDERGYPFALRQMFPGQHPVVLMLGYYGCPSMCGQVLDAAFRSLSAIDDLQPGEHYRILSVSIDPKETPEVAAHRKSIFLPRLQKTGGDDAWRLLVGDAENTSRLAAQVGFNYYWVEASREYAHPASLIFLTPEGKISRTIVNNAFDPRDVRLAIVEASQGTIGTFWDQVQLNCLTFDPTTNTYSLAAMTIMRIGGALTLVALVTMIWVMLRRERQKANESSRQSRPDAATV
jgi:protein SCO1